MPRLLPFLALFLTACATPNPIKATWIPDNGWWMAASAGGGNLRTADNKLRQINPIHARNLREAQLAIQKQSRMDVELALVEADAPNAFATSTQGKPTIAISLDLLAALGNDRDALATTLGHEVAHLYYSHGTARQERATAGMVGSQVLGTLLGLAGVPMGGTIASVGVTAVTTSFSRDEEREADAKGLEWATAAGYSACGSARTIRFLDSRSSGGSIPFLSSHPGHEERRESATAMSVKLTGKGC